MSGRDSFDAAAHARSVIGQWLAYVSDWAAGRDKLVCDGFLLAANAVALGRLGPPPGATNCPATAKATKPAGPWSLEKFASDKSPDSPYVGWERRRIDDASFADGVAAERATVVAWLRHFESGNAQYLADAIEAGAHREPRS